MRHNGGHPLQLGQGYDEQGFQTHGPIYECFHLPGVSSSTGIQCMRLYHRRHTKSSDVDHHQSIQDLQGQRAADGQLLVLIDGNRPDVVLRSILEEIS
jgi:hypothetical protein